MCVSVPENHQILSSRFDSLVMLNKIANYINWFNLKSIKISSQTQPEASPVGLRLVGLLPCAVWTPKIPKPTVASQARITSAPYSTAAAAHQTPRLPQRAEACRCSIPTPPSTINSQRPALIGPSPVVRSSTVTSTSTSNNSMLLVPFAVPGFVPVQQQQQQHHSNVTNQHPPPTIHTTNQITPAPSVSSTLQTNANTKASFF